jgi:hypothetical protein
MWWYARESVYGSLEVEIWRTGHPPPTLPTLSYENTICTRNYMIELEILMLTSYFDRKGYVEGKPL